MAKPTVKIDNFTLRRLERFITAHRSSTGQLPTLADLSGEGFEPILIDQAIKTGVLEQLYVTLTNGTVVKGFKLKPPGPGAI